MILLTLRHWFSLIWERPLHAVGINLTALLILGFGFGIFSAFPVPSSVYTAITVVTAVTFLIFWGGSLVTAANIREGKSWKYSDPWKYLKKGLAPAAMSLAFGTFLFLIWQISLPSYLSRPDLTPPENPIPVSVMGEGESYRLSWRDPLDSDLAFIQIEWEDNGVYRQGRMDPGLGTFLFPSGLSSLKVTLKAEDWSGRRSEGTALTISPSAWEPVQGSTGLRQTPLLMISGVNTDGVNLDWGWTSGTTLLDRNGQFRLLSADTKDGLPGTELELVGTTRVVMNWTDWVTRRAFSGLGLGKGAWYQAQALFDGTEVFATEPVYVTTLGIGNLIVAGILVTLLIWGVLTLPFWVPWKNQTGEGWLKSLRHSQIFASQNLLFILWANLILVFLFFVSAFLLTTLPGLLGLGLWYEESLRMRLKALAYLKENPEVDRIRAPWRLIFAEEVERMKGRGIRGLFTPWK